jgi:hypothetical protein
MPDRLRALRRFPYGGRVYVRGDILIASAPDAKALVAGINPAAERFDEDPPAPTLATLVARDLIAEQPAEEPMPKRKRRRPLGSKNTYKSRDMRAE